MEKKSSGHTSNERSRCGIRPPPTGNCENKAEKCADTANGPQKQYYVQKLKSRKKLEFNCAVRNRFEAPENMTEDSIDIVWATLQETWKEAFEEVLCKKEKKHKV